MAKRAASAAMAKNSATINSAKIVTIPTPITNLEAANSTIPIVKIAKISMTRKEILTRSFVTLFQSKIGIGSSCLR